MDYYIQVEKSEEMTIKSPIPLKQQVNLHLLIFNLKAYKESEFEERCSEFIIQLLSILKRIEMKPIKLLLKNLENINFTPF